MILEICVDQLAGVIAAKDGGADRVELCSGLGVGGLTPSEGLLAASCESAPELSRMVLIRPREGDFVYSQHDMSVAHRDIQTARRYDSAGIVFGTLTAAGEIDLSRCREIIDAARPLSVTFHRAFDVCREPLAALEQLIELGFDRVLTSGQARRAIDGASLLADLVRSSNDRIGVIAGGGVDNRNVELLIRSTKVREIHASASIVKSGSSGRRPMAIGEMRVTCPDKVAALGQILRRVERRSF